MNNFEALEFDKILSRLSERAVSNAVKERCLAIVPCTDITEAERRLKETTDAKHVIEHMGTPPLAAMNELQKIIGLLGIDAMLIPDQISCVSMFIMSCRRMRDFLKRAEPTGSETALYGASFIDLSDLLDEIDRCVRHGQVEDRASQHLYELRRNIDVKNEQIKTKLESILRRNTDCFSENFVAVRNGRFTLPVKKAYRNRIEGALIEVSNSGGTCFIEPVQARKFQNELSELNIEEENEVRRILYTLTALIYESLPSLKLNIEAMETLDFLFAKAKLSIDMKAGPIRIIEQREIRVLSARHPLLSNESAVPLDFALGGEFKGMVITGPNTGGKTVTIKTVGLLSLMAQSGLHVPADERSAMCMFDKALCDIGDGQSISENLSTFSSHITNIIEILKQASINTLVLLDELGSGTDPAEGMGIAAAVLESLCEKNCLFAATTHYPEIKEFAAVTPGLINARMAFNRENLMPLYKLEIGEAGESCALYIAERLGMPQGLLNRAREIAYSKTPAFANAANNANILPVSPIEPMEPPEQKTIPRCNRFTVGDSVTVYPQKEIGLVYAPANEKGEIGVQIKGKKKLINHKRLKIKVDAGELYPDDYDLSIVFESVSVRKARHVMERKHVEGNEVRY